MATLNPCSMSFGESEFSNPPKDVARLAARMLELGVKPELEIYDTGHLEACLRLRDAGLLDEPLQFSIVLGVRGGMAATPQNLLMMAERLPDNAIWQVIAIGSANLRLTAMGLALGGNARAGLEDALYVRKGELARGNAPLVSRAVRLARGSRSRHGHTRRGPPASCAQLGHPGGSELGMSATPIERRGLPGDLGHRAGGCGRCSQGRPSTISARLARQ